MTGQRFPARLRGIAHRLGREKAGRQGKHALRRGAVRAILESGGSFARLLSAGQSHSSSFCLFLDLGAEEAAAMARVFTEASDDEAGTAGARGEGVPYTYPLQIWDPNSRGRLG